MVEGAVGGFEAGFDPGTPGMDGTGGGQTREHAQLARSLGLEQLAIVVTKLDTVADPQVGAVAQVLIIVRLCCVEPLCSP